MKVLSRLVRLNDRHPSDSNLVKGNVTIYRSEVDELQSHDTITFNVFSEDGELVAQPVYSHREFTDALKKWSKVDDNGQKINGLKISFTEY